MTTDQPSFEPPPEPDSHLAEVRTSLAVVIGRSQLLQRRMFRVSPPSDQELVNVLDLIIGHSWNVARLLDSRQRHD